MAKKVDAIIPGGVEEYIKSCPTDIQAKLKNVREAIKQVVPDSIETVSYFEFPGYGYPNKGYDYNGMFAWFSYKKPFIRVHVRPPVIANHKKELAGCKLNVGAVSFPEDMNIPLPLVKTLVKESLGVMKAKAKP